MIGMSQIKKRLINGILIGLGIGLVLVLITVIISVNIVSGYKEGTNKTFLERYTSNVVTFTRDVVQGETITEDMLMTTRIHINTVPSGAYTSTLMAVGQVAKYNIVRNSIAVAGMLSDKIISQDVRIQEINSLLLPTDLVETDFIDIRIMYPSGVEYTVLTQKQVNKIVGTTIWMNMSEHDTLMLNSAIVDSYLTEGSKLYAVRYSDPTTQIKLEETDEVLSAARDYIRRQLGSELEAYDKIGDTYISENVPTGQVDIYGEQITTRVPTVTEDVAELLTKYAIEYRYYVESYNRTEINYQPNEQVMAFMKENKNIVEQAKAKLDAQARQNIKMSIATFENSSGESYGNVISGIEGAVSAQQALRGNALQEEE